MAGRRPLPDHSLDLAGIADLDTDHLHAELRLGKDVGHLLAVQPDYRWDDSLAGADEPTTGDWLL
jgi:hypothetical protein